MRNVLKQILILCLGLTAVKEELESVKFPFLLLLQDETG